MRYACVLSLHSSIFYCFDLILAFVNSDTCNAYVIELSDKRRLILKTKLSRRIDKVNRYAILPAKGIYQSLETMLSEGCQARAGRLGAVYLCRDRLSDC